ncbi:aquaporin-10-like [Gigantopelta aegis]|uniref:aquaporin-10-like n=1 Tax=Gigantopelta aegis TaxID=1735272 RepID=UPI001B88CE07|nr:aquaporin-10-like [Gigantopelta aegis]
MSTKLREVCCERKRNLHEYPLVRDFLAEALGTFILLVFGQGSVAQFVLSGGQSGSMMSIHWSWGIGVMMGVYVAGGISGGHLNPAVTIAQAFLGRLYWIKVPVYIIAQYVGSFLGSLCVYLVYTDALNAFDGGVRTVDPPTGTAGIWCTFPRPEVSTWNCFGDQVFSTGILLICIMAITDKKNMAPASGLAPISIGFVVFVIGMTFGHNCGYAINPARDLAPRIFTLMAGWGTGVFSYRNFNYFWVPVMGPHIGAILGCFIYKFCVGYHWPDEGVIKDEAEEIMLNDCEGSTVRPADEIDGDVHEYHA